MLACFLAGDRAPRHKLMSRSANRHTIKFAESSVAGWRIIFL
jgi:hypothetical protein